MRLRSALAALFASATVALPIAATAQSNVFVGQYTNYGPGNSIFERAADGTLVRTLAVSPAIPYDMEFGPDGYLYVATRFPNTITRYDPVTGASAGTVGSFGGALEFAPTGFAFAPSGGTLFVLDYNGTGSSAGLFRIDVATNAQALLTTLSSYSYDVAVRPDNGNVLASNAAGTEVLEYNSLTGALVGTFSTGYTSVFGMTFGPDGRFYTNEYATGADPLVRVASATGGASSAFSTGSFAGTYASSDLAFNSDGSLYVTSGATTGSGRVLHFGSNGAYLDEFASAGAYGLGIRVAVTATPEPGTVALVGAGLLAVGTVVRRRREVAPS